LEAFAAVPRAEFVDPSQRDHAYDDGPLPIGYGQTISQPYVVAVTVQALALSGEEHVLEIGAGSDYAAAILGKLAREVHTLVRIGRRDETTYDEQNLGEVRFVPLVGEQGWPEDFN